MGPAHLAGDGSDLTIARAGAVASQPRLDSGARALIIEFETPAPEATTSPKQWTTFACGLAALASLAAARDARAQEPSDTAAAAESVAVRKVTVRGAQVRVLDDPDEFAEGRFLVLLVRSMAQGRTPPALLACVVSGAGSAMKAACVPVPTPGAAGDGETFELSAFDVTDIDGDGQDEACIEVSYVGAWVRPGVGSEFHRLSVLRLAPRPTVAFTLETLRSDMATDRFVVRRVIFTDLDGDGHADALVAQWTCSEPPAADSTTYRGSCWRSTEHHRWLAATRRWGPAIPIGN